MVTVRPKRKQPRFPETPVDMSIHTTHTAGTTTPHHPSRIQSQARGPKTPKGTQATGEGLSSFRSICKGVGAWKRLQRHLQETVKSSGCCFPCGQQAALLTAVGTRDPSFFLSPLPPSGIFHSPLDTHTYARTHACTRACMHAHHFSSRRLTLTRPIPSFKSGCSTHPQMAMMVNRNTNL